MYMNNSFSCIREHGIKFLILNLNLLEGSIEEKASIQTDVLRCVLKRLKWKMVTKFTLKI